MIKSVYNGTANISSHRPKIWDLVSSSVKEVNQLQTVKKSIKKNGNLLTVLALWNTEDMNPVHF